MSAILTIEETEANLQQRHLQRESEAVQGSYGAAIIGLYLFGMICGFAFLVSETSLTIAASAFFAFLLSCSGAILLVWWHDNKLWGAGLVRRMQAEHVGAGADREEREAFGVTPP